jgi:hypothetical protein
MTEQAELDLSVWWIGAGIALLLVIWFAYDLYLKRRRVNRQIDRLRRFRARSAEDGAEAPSE